MKTLFGAAKTSALRNPFTGGQRWRASQLLLALGASLMLYSCANTRTAVQSAAAIDTKLVTAYDFALVRGDAQPLSLTAMADALQGKDVVFIGEYHGNHASHLLEMQLFAKLHQLNRANNRPTILSMEMFNRDQQQILDDYLEGKIGERYLIEEAPTWKNYRAAYRPLIEFAKQQTIAVVAANAPGAIVRCIGRKGETYIDKLDRNKKLSIAQQPFAAIPGYKDKFFEVMGKVDHMPPAYLQQSYLAQLSRDNTMAESIAQAYQAADTPMIVHLNGTFHSEQGLGTVGALKRLQPKLNMAVITPIHREDFTAAAPHSTADPKDDFYYIIQPLPEEFVDDEYRDKIHGKMFSKAGKKADQCQ